MALIKCPECKKKVSDKCGNCPNCGYPIEAQEVVFKENNLIVEEKKEVVKEKLPKTRKPVNKKVLIGIISSVCAIFLIVVFTLLGLTYFNETWKDATHNFEVVSNKLERMNNELDSLIQKSENVVETEDIALNEETRAILKGAISDAKQARKEVSRKPLLAKDIEIATNMMEQVDYTDIVKSLEEKYIDFDKSIKQYKLVDNPTEEYLLSRLKTVKGIFNITAYTEETDTNKYLNKAKWYYSKIVFQHEDVQHSAIEYGHPIEEVGNPAGGCVEAFKTVEDAERRNQELQSQEGTVRSPGSHKVIGTVLVRTSDDLTTAKQKELEQAIIDALTYIEEVDGEKEIPKEQETETTEPSTSAPTTSKPATSNSLSQNSTNEQTNNKPTTPVTSKNQEAVNAAKEIVDFYATVYPNMVRDLLMDDYGFTESQANYGVKNANIDWNYYAVIHLEEYVGMNEGNVTKSDAERYLGADKGYSDSTIKYALLNANIDWTATEQKKQDNNCLGHHMDVPTCKKSSTCIYCGYTEGEPIDCQYIDGVCHFCGDKQE